MKQLTGIENVEEIIKGLNILFGPFPKLTRLDLSLFYTVIKLPRRSFLRPVDFYYLLDGFITAALRDSLSSNTVLLSFVFPYDSGILCKFWIGLGRRVWLRIIGFLGSIGGRFFPLIFRLLI
ncbi:hypothetical protein Ahos_1753 [Acidianus hospitalis W1]|uniref:Uncharacterized protein n=1 Tax=Acidianus hospitalis (strain W1) TaxID=933801 RepID=F4B6T7_ACIHW|nr:hypothetical protein [Acidianus hospitalis]AEE94630.1 hypothetical protein Ahos_1753 [Acidianus hospitalis W1]